MGTPIHEETYRDHTIKIVPDPDPENPRDYDNLGTMSCWHRRYMLGDKHDREDPRDLLVDLCGLDGDTDLPMNALIERASRRAVILPLYLYDHSGITMNTTGFHCLWDSGQVGYIYVTLDDIRKDYGVTRVSKNLRTRIADHLRQEVQTYDHYLTGNCYGFIVEKDDDEVASCWGFLGDYDGYCLAEAKSSVN
ncbi:hypothetical protein [Roseovarius sp. M141]|uniref:Uncharacterized protein n=2 Tax=Pelagivirga sediminicola TaxID=2170575 RepID=A0A2T7G3W1_9RHOB|nr:hypothetical protein [Roseovarius sp. M141]MCQ0090365.1 hypothetical protein [Roseovarius sp. M141]PVA09080.1 hypothetical protein DC366_15870 [Pelagivirga sediminicola]